MTTPIPATLFSEPAPAQRLDQAAAALTEHGFTVEILDDVAAARARVKENSVAGIGVVMMPPGLVVVWRLVRMQAG